MSAIARGNVALVGRADELELIERALSTSESPAFVIAGPAGVGKTRLAGEVAARARLAGYCTAHVVATNAASTIPFGAFAPVLPEIKPTKGGVVGYLQSAGDALLDRFAVGSQLLLLVDDAQLLDEGSATLVQQLAQVRRCSVVVTLRTPGVAPDPITSLWKEGVADRVDLCPLDKQSLSDLATTLLGAPITPSALHWLFETSKGNPLFARELLRGAAEAGSLSDEGGVWYIRLPWRAPDVLVELVEHRIAGLPAATIEVGELLALGEPLGIDLLEAVTHLQAIEHAETEGLIDVREEGRRSVVGLVHPVYGEILRQRMGGARRRRLAGKLAAASQATPRRRHDDALRLARWQLDAGWREDRDLLSTATMLARRMFDKPLTIRIGSAAVEAGAGPEVGAALADALMNSGRHDEAEAVLARYAGLCTTDAERAVIARARVYNLTVLIGDLAGGMECLDEVLAVMTDAEARLAVISAGATIRLVAGDLRTALEEARELRASDDPVNRKNGAYAAAFVLAMLGRSEEAIETAFEAFEAQRAGGGVVRIAERLLVPASMALAAGGQLERAIREARHGHDRALDAGDTDLVSSFALVLGLVQVDAGRLREASLSFRAGSAMDREINDLLMLRWSLGGTALAEAMAGHQDAAEAALVELDALPGHWANLFDVDLIDRARAWVKAVAGEITAACAMLRSAAATAAERGLPVTEARLLHDLVRLGAPHGASARLAELAETVDGALVRAFAAHATARERGRGADLLEAAQALVQTGSLLAAAEAFEAAATAFGSEALARQESAARRRAAELLTMMGVASASHGPGLANIPVPLTRREREVALLAATGITSQAIAERLFLSVRTVHNHLQHAYTKLGVSRREDLAKLLTSQAE